jgi:hypothetical protein
MDESAHFGVLLPSDITSDAVLSLSWDAISRRLETRLQGKRSISRFRTTLSEESAFPRWWPGVARPGSVLVNDDQKAQWKD